MTNKTDTVFTRMVQTQNYSAINMMVNRWILLLERLGIYLSKFNLKNKGEYVNGMRHGIGSYLYENGDRYEGKTL